MEYADPYFLGDPKAVPDEYSPKYKVRFNHGGFNSSRKIKDKKAARWLKNGMPESVLASLRAFPDHPGGIGGLIDDSIDKVKAQFAACGGELANKAARVDPRKIYVVIEPAPFWEPYHSQFVPSLFSPSENLIRSLAAYYQFEHQWLRHAKDLLLWEWENFFAWECGRVPEPRIDGWPCTAPKR